MQLYKNPHDIRDMPIFTRSKYCVHTVPLHGLHRIVRGDSATFNEKWAMYKMGVIEKKSLPSVVVGGTCKVGDRCLISGMLSAQTGFLAFDVDEGKFDADKVKSEFISVIDPMFDPVLVFISPRGKALKWIIRPHYICAGFDDTHKLYTKYQITEYGWPVTAQGQSNINRKTFLSIDKKVWINKKYDEV